MSIQYLLKHLGISLCLLLASISIKVFAAEQPARTEISFTAIKTFATFSNAAYLAESDIRELGKQKQFTLSHYGTIPEIEIAYFLLSNETNKTQVIAVRGTSNLENAMVDVALQLSQDSQAGVRLHRGFSEAAQAIYREIKPQLGKEYAISTTGHSLGGAVALVLAMYLDVDGFNIAQVVTFGQPKVTNIAGATRFQHLKVFRLVTPRDLVPLVPPFDPVDINNLDIYWHLGKEVILLEDTHYAVTEGLSSMLRATRFTQESLNERNLTEHQMSLYLALINKKLTAAKQLPYKTSLNLFNLFGVEEN